MAPLVRRSARAILVDDQRRLVLMKRSRPDGATYWTAPGGGIEPTDGSPLDALHRELREELGAVVDRCEQVFLFTSADGDGLAVQHFFVCRLRSLDPDARRAPEFTQADRGTYEPERVAMSGSELQAIDLRPAALKEFILTRRDALLDTAAVRAT